MGAREGAITVESLKSAFWQGMAVGSTITFVIMCTSLLISKWYFGG